MKRILLCSLLMVGCKQGKGDRCQVDTDCQDGLLCNKANMQCQGTNGGDFDAEVPDRPKGDGGVGDAPSDTVLGG